MQILKNYKYILAVVFITFLVAFSYIRIYTVTELGGDFNKHFLPANMFGVPQALKDQGLDTLYKLPEQSGWDGQFYYYISNDILGVSDVPKHCDADAYRYQRIGLPLLANILAKVTFQDYTSPATYYMTSLLLILAATFFFAKFLSDRGYSPYLSLFWSLGLGTQLTLLNGLPDAAADSLALLAILAYIYNRKWLFSILILFASLSREAFAIFPIMILLQQMYIAYRNKMFNPFLFIKNEISVIIPLAFFGAWRIYILKHFLMTPSEQAANILGLPLVSFFKYLGLSLQFKHPLVPNSWSELIGLIYFIILLSIAVAVIWSVSKKILHERDYANKLLPISSGFIILVFLYLSFGDTVMMHHTGYMKASTIFFFMIPVYFTMSTKKFPILLFLFFLFGLINFNKEIINRIHPNNIANHALTVRTFDITKFPEKVECLSDFSYEVKILSEKEIGNNNPINLIVQKMLGHNKQKLLTIELKNTSTEIWPISKGFGIVNMSYHWVAKDGVTVVQDGVRTMLPREIKAGEKIVLDMIVEFPSNSENLILKLSPVQEGCTWFIQKNKRKINATKSNY